MLTVHRSERGDRLVDALAEQLRAGGDDPFATEVIAVPTRGVERWITQRIASRLGVAANISYPSLDQLVSSAVAAASGIDRESDPWAPDRLVWLVLDALDGLASDGEHPILARHLGIGSTDSSDMLVEHKIRRRYPTAELVARLLSGYSANRPTMLVDWAQGNDTDGVGGLLPDDLRWQADLFRRLRDLAGVPSPAERLGVAVDRLREEPHLADLPARFSIYGPTRITVTQAAILRELADTREVHLWLPHPSPALWALSPKPDSVNDDVVPRSEATILTNPLLASLGREVRELQVKVRHLASHDIHHPGPTRASTLLGRLQDAIASNSPPPTGVSVADGSVEFHACHGAARMVEALRERLVRLFDDDPTLEPRDVLIGCPDVETFAPLIRSAFSESAANPSSEPAGANPHPAQRLRVRMADRSVRFTNPLLDATVTVLDLAGGRATIAQVLDFAATEPVRRKFRFTDSDVERLRDWAEPSGARWGLTAAAREPYGLSGFPQNTLATALDRLVLGVAADESESEWLSLALPLDDVDSTDIDLVGRYAQLIDVLTRFGEFSRARHSAHVWLAQLTDVASDIAAVAPNDAWQVAQAQRELASALHAGGERGGLTLSEVAVLMSARLRAKPTRANFRTGELTVCTLAPMRSVPHRVIVLLGLDDDVFPRTTRFSGDDVLGRTPALGERDPRAEDRQVFLDSVMSAQDRFLVFYTGADPVKGTLLPPAVPVAELRDAAYDALTDPTTAGLDFHHTLQPFDVANFVPGRFIAGQSLSYDPAAYAGALASVGESVPEPPFLSARLPSSTVEDVNLDELVGFCAHPVRAFLRQRLGFTVPDTDDELPTELAIVADSLQQWAMGERMLAAELAGVPPDRFTATELRRGTLPPFAFGQLALDQVAQQVSALSRAAAPYLGPRPTTVDVSIDLGGNRMLVGSVPDLRGDKIMRVSYSRLAARHRIMGWVNLLAVTAGTNRAAEAVVIGRRGSGAGVSRFTPPPSPVAELRILADLRDRGLVEPLPIFPTASSVYAVSRQSGRTQADSIESARAEFSSKFGDGTDRAINYVFGGAAFADALVSPRDDERAFSHETTRFGALAARLWVGPLRHEELSR